MYSFMKIKSSRNVEFSLSLTEVGDSCSSANLKFWQICLFNVIREN